MVAKEVRLWSSSCHFSLLRPKLIESLKTARWCHITSAPAGTPPSILRMAILSRPP